MSVWAYRFAGMIALGACASAGVDRGPDAGSGSGSDATVRADAAIDAPPACTTSGMCATAMMLGSVSGDSGNQKLMAMGSGGAWFRVRVTEDNSSVAGLTLRVGAKLTSPSAVSFDVLVYVNVGSDTIECTTTLGTTTTSGNVDEVRAEWGEGTIANGADDGRDVSIEVRPPASGCSQSQTWSLTVEGNWI